MNELYWIDLQKIDGDSESASPTLLFVQLDLYTTFFGAIINDDIERFLFGRIDDQGARAVRAFVEADHSAVHKWFVPFFQYLDAQRLRTPRGLDWIRSPYSKLGQLELMLEMQALRQMNCTMWLESVKEIVSAANSQVKFIVTDHPVTIYHQDCSPTGDACRYPSDPAIEWIGSQTMFPLDANHCLILTHLEHAKGAKPEMRMTSRTNARYRGTALFRTDAIIRGRKLADAEVIAINSVLKARARRFIAAGQEDWLFPERSTPADWDQVGSVLLPRDGHLGIGGDILIGYEDGTSEYSDAFGRRSRAHAYLQKPHAGNLQAEEQCGCGNGRSYGECCSPLPVQDRPTWTQRGIRERNLMLIHDMRAIFGLDKGRSWEDVRRELDDDQVRQLHSAFGALWPQDTGIAELLPRPRPGITRGLFLAPLDPRTVPIAVHAMLNYFDELVLPHPLVNPHVVRPEYSPLHSPAGFREYTICSAYVLLLLEDLVGAGRVHLVPDPMDIDETFRREMIATVEDAKKSSLCEDDRQILKRLWRDDELRWVRRLPVPELLNFLRRNGPDAAPEVLDRVAHAMKAELLADPIALLQDSLPGEEGAQFKVMKGFNQQTGLFLASLTGSIPYAHLRMFVDRLLVPEEGGDIELSRCLQDRADRLAGFAFPLQLDGTLSGEVPDWLSRRKAVFRLLFAQIAEGAEPTLDELDRLLQGLSSEDPSTLPDMQNHIVVKGWFPVGSLARTDVARLLLIYGRSFKKVAVPAAMYIGVQAASTLVAAVSDSV